MEGFKKINFGRSESLEIQKDHQKISLARIQWWTFFLSFVKRWFRFKAENITRVALHECWYNTDPDQHNPESFKDQVISRTSALPSTAILL